MDFASTTSRRLSLATLLALLPAAPAFAVTPVGTFTGDFSIGSPATYTASGPAGNWSVTIATSGPFSLATVNTQNAPNSVSLFADINASTAASSHVAPATGPLTGSALAEISIAAPSAGVFSFDVSGATSSVPGIYTGSIYAFVGSSQFSLAGQSSFSLTLAPGDIFGFVAKTEPVSSGASGGRAGLAGLPGLAAPTPSSTLNISNPVFTPVPEASTIYAGLALMGMGAFAWRRSRRHS